MFYRDDTTNREWGRRYWRRWIRRRTRWYRYHFIREIVVQYSTSVCLYKGKYSNLRNPDVPKHDWTHKVSVCVLRLIHLFLRRRTPRFRRKGSSTFGQERKQCIEHRSPMFYHYLLLYSSWSRIWLAEESDYADLNFNNKCKTWISLKTFVLREHAWKHEMSSKN